MFNPTLIICYILLFKIANGTSVPEEILEAQFQNLFQISPGFDLELQGLDRQD
jgi:hypothetical protein